MKTNLLCVAFLIAAVSFVNYACAYRNGIDWRRSPEQASASCERGEDAACEFMLSEGLLTEQYAHSGSGKVTTSGPRY